MIAVFCFDMYFLSTLIKSLDSICIVQVPCKCMTTSIAEAWYFFPFVIMWWIQFSSQNLPFPSSTFQLPDQVSQRGETSTLRRCVSRSSVRSFCSFPAESRLPWWTLVPDLITLRLTAESKSRMLAADKKTFHRQTKRRSAAGELQLRLKLDGDSNVSDFFWFFFLYFCSRKYLFIFPRSSSVVCFCFVRSWISHTASSSALTRAEPWELRSNYTLRQNVLQKWHEKYVGHI